MRPRVLDRRILIGAGLAVLVLGPLYGLLGARSADGATLLERLISRLGDTMRSTAVTTLAVLAGYEAFFSVQQLVSARPKRTVQLGLDRLIPFVPSWVWIYGVAYYGIIGSPLAFIRTPRELLAFVAGGIVLLVASFAVFLAWPTRCPPAWRRYELSGVSTRVLAFIQRFDDGSCCLPSLHTAFAAYAAAFLPMPYAVVFPLLVAASCVLVKQHSILDLPVGAALGFAVGQLVLRV